MDRQYDEYARSRLAGQFSEMSSFRFVYPYLKNKRVLDIGCSDGLYLAKFNAESVGIEQVPELAEAAQKRGLNVVVGDLHQSICELPNDHFGGVLFSHVMEHVENPFTILREIARVLEQDGLLVLGLPTERNIYRDLLGMDYFDGTHLLAFTARNANKILVETGFRVKQAFYHLPRCRGQLGRAVETVWNSTSWPLQEYFSMAYWMVAEKTNH